MSYSLTQAIGHHCSLMQLRGRRFLVRFGGYGEESLPEALAYYTERLAQTSNPTGPNTRTTRESHTASRNFRHDRLGVPLLVELATGIVASPVIADADKALLSMNCLWKYSSTVDTELGMIAGSTRVQLQIQEHLLTFSKQRTRFARRCFVQRARRACTWQWADAPRRTSPRPLCSRCASRRAQIRLTLTQMPMPMPMPIPMPLRALHLWLARPRQLQLHLRNPPNPTKLFECGLQRHCRHSAFGGSNRQARAHLCRDTDMPLRWFAFRVCTALYRIIKLHKCQYTVVRAHFHNLFRQPEALNYNLYSIPLIIAFMFIIIWTLIN